MSIEQFRNSLSEEEKRASQVFIERIKNQVLKKRTLPNSAEPYPIEKAAESIEHFYGTEDFQQMLRGS